MKFVAFLMALLVLVLSVMPCADNDGFYKSNLKTTITKAAQQQDRDAMDDCSPFCQCSCCAGFSLHHDVADLERAPWITTNPSPAFLPSNAIQVALPIWQPPQLV